MHPTKTKFVVYETKNDVDDLANRRSQSRKKGVGGCFVYVILRAST